MLAMTMRSCSRKVSNTAIEEKTVDAKVIHVGLVKGGAIGCQTCQRSPHDGRLRKKESEFSRGSQMMS